MGSKMATTTCFLVISGYKLAWHKPTFRTQIECVLTDSGNSQHLNPSIPLTISIIKWLDTNEIMEFISHNHHHTPTFESRVVKILAGVPTFHTKIEHVDTESAISYQLDQSNLSL